MDGKEKDAIQELCLKKQVVRSEFINPDSIVIEQWTRFKCQYGCRGYGKSLCCPPHSPTPEETLKIIAAYRIGLLLQFNGTQVTKAIAEIEREIFLKNFYKVISFGAGPCRLCKECTLTECTVPALARPSMEACGIDVYQTVRNNGFEINVLQSKDEQQKRFGLVLIE